MKSPLLKTLLALAAGVFAAQSAHAQYLTAGASSEDLILSFRDTSGTYKNNLQIDLGSVSNFLGNSPTFTSLNLNTDLTNISSTFFTNSNIAFSILGADESGSGDVWVSDPSTAVFNSASKSSLKATPVQDAEALYGPYTGASAASAANGILVATSNPNSYSSINSLGNFNYFSASDGSNTTPETTFGLGSNPTLYLDALVPNASSLVTNSSGANYAFTINSQGILSYGAVATPEPSTYALMFLAAIGLFVVSRRKSASSL